VLKTVTCMVLLLTIKMEYEPHVNQQDVQCVMEVVLALCAIGQRIYH